MFSFWGREIHVYRTCYVARPYMHEFIKYFFYRNKNTHTYVTISSSQNAQHIPFYTFYFKFYACSHIHLMWQFVFTSKTLNFTWYVRMQNLVFFPLKTLLFPRIFDQICKHSKILIYYKYNWNVIKHSRSIKVLKNNKIRSSCLC